jgi:hypothetical protein
VNERGGAKMNLSIPNPEMMRQHEHYDKVRRRLLGSPVKASEAVEIKKAVGVRGYELEQAHERIWQSPILIETLPNRVAMERLRIQAEYGVTKEELMGTRRFKTFVEARHALMFRLYSNYKWTLHQIGRYFGGKDHTTILHGVRTHARRVGLWIEANGHKNHRPVIRGMSDEEAYTRD